MKTRLLLMACLLSGLTFAQTIGIQEFADGFDDPVELVHAGDSRFFVVEQAGLIKILNSDGTTNAAPFLNLANVISTGSERGLLGLAFHPDYADNGYFFVNYTNTAGNTVVARYSRSSSNPALADPTSATTIITINQPYSNHNGGCLRFGPDGYLYIGMGDGGSGDDPENRAQNLNELLGKMLRLDVDNGAPYSIPPGNPYVGVTGADEIWAYGLRNPWKFSFNKDNGDLWIADVGQNNIEEINKNPSTTAGLNYGWRCYEGNDPYIMDQCSGTGVYTMPFAQYTHGGTNGCSITGGYVYTGGTYPALQGKYIFADYCNNKIGMVNEAGAITYTAAFGGNNFTTFGEDMNGELYIAGKSSGTIYRIIDTSLSTTAFNKGISQIFPNPATDEVTINITTTGTAIVSMYDLGGKLLLQQPIREGSGQVNTSALQSGLYLVEVKTAEESQHHKLIIN